MDYSEMISTKIEIGIEADVVLKRHVLGIKCFTWLKR